MSVRVLHSYDGLPVFQSYDGRKWGVTSLSIAPVTNIQIRKVGSVDVVQYGVECAVREFLFQFSHLAFASKRLRDDNEWLAGFIKEWLRENVPCYVPCCGWSNDAQPLVVNI